MTIKILKGSHKIGGSITEIKTDKARIIIDMGEDLPCEGETNKFEIEGVTTGNKNCDAVFISHYHDDHIGMCNKVLDNIPIYTGELTKEIYLILNNKLKSVMPEINIDKIERFKTFKAKDKIKIQDITITPYFVDHSAIDAHMFLIEANDKRILHTGDFRTHGFIGKGLIPTLEKYIKNVDVLITEGTLLSREDTDIKKERYLQDEARDIFKKYKYVFVLCSSTNIDRMASLHCLCKQTDRLFICDDYQKKVLEAVSKYSGTKTCLYNFDKIFTKAYKDSEKSYGHMEEKGFCMIVRASGSKESKNKFKDVMDRFKDKSTFLYSLWDGYKKENKPYTNDDIVDICNKYDFKYFHTSGHATKEDIIEVCKIVNPRIIIPIHTEAPEKLEQSINNVNILKDEEEYEL